MDVVLALRESLLSTCLINLPGQALVIVVEVWGCTFDQ